MSVFGWICFVGLLLVIFAPILALLYGIGYLIVHAFQHLYHRVVRVWEACPYCGQQMNAVFPGNSCPACQQQVIVWNGHLQRVQDVTGK
ncbi:MAG: hypothetical protein ACYDBB_17775 [Armatimonadota bacterium]